MATQIENLVTKLSFLTTQQAIAQNKPPMVRLGRVPNNTYFGEAEDIHDATPPLAPLSP